jgi:hypothetical protein
MTVGGWLQDRFPAPPERLAERIVVVLGDRCERDAAQTTTLCIDAAEQLLRDLMTRPSPGRESALDLLTVDALVTYAFEAASEVPDSLESLATSAMLRLAATAGE